MKLAEEMAAKATDVGDRKNRKRKRTAKGRDWDVEINRETSSGEEPSVQPDSAKNDIHTTKSAKEKNVAKRKKSNKSGDTKQEKTNQKQAQKTAEIASRKSLAAQFFGKAADSEKGQDSSEKQMAPIIVDDCSDQQEIDRRMTEKYDMTDIDTTEPTSTVRTTQQCEHYTHVQPDKTMPGHTPLTGRPQSTLSTTLIARPAGLTPSYNPAPQPTPPITPVTQPTGLTATYNPAPQPTPPITPVTQPADLVATYNPAPQPSKFTPALKPARTPLMQVDNTPVTPIIGTPVRTHPAKTPLTSRNVNADPRTYETPTSSRFNQHATSSMEPIRHRQQEREDFGGIFRSSLSLALGEEAENYSYLDDLHADEPREDETNACANCEVLKREIEALKQNQIPGTSFTYTLY